MVPSRILILCVTFCVVGTCAWGATSDSRFNRGTWQSQPPAPAPGASRITRVGTTPAPEQPPAIDPVSAPAPAPEPVAGAAEAEPFFDETFDDEPAAGDEAAPADAGQADDAADVGVEDDTDPAPDPDAMAAAPGAAAPGGEGAAADAAGAPAPGRGDPITPAGAADAGAARTGERPVGTIEVGEVIEPGAEDRTGRPGTIHMGDVQVTAFLSFLAGYKNMPVIYDSINAKTYFDRAITIDRQETATYEVVKAILETNGFAVVERKLADGSRIIEVMAAKVPRQDSGGEPIVDVEAGVHDFLLGADEVVTIILPIRYADTREVQNILTQVFGAGPAGKSGATGVQIVPVERTNTLIVKAKFSLLDYVRQIVARVDVELPGEEQIIEIIDIREADVVQLANLVDQVLRESNRDQQAAATGAATPGSAIRARMPTTGAAAARPGTALARARGMTTGGYGFQTVLIPEERTQKLIVITTSEYELELVRTLVDELDTEVSAIRRRTHIYQVRYLTAADVADVLTALIEGVARRGGLTGRTTGTRAATTRLPLTAGGAAAATPAATTSRASDTFTHIVPHEQTNSLLIQADPEQYEEILYILNGIDRKRNQVFLESALIQVAEKSDLNFTIETLAGQFDNRSTRAAAMSSLGLSTVDPTLLPDVFDRMLLNTAPTTGLFGAISRKGQLPLLVRFFKQDNETQVIATPFILADDNERNMLVISTTTYVLSTSAIGTQTTISEPRGEEAGVRLSLTPTISRNAVLLDLELEVSEFAQTVTVAGNLPDKSKNSITGRVSVPDGELFVVGGLTSETNARSVDKIPILGDLPLLGFLFQSKSTSRRRSNLYAFLTAHVLSDKYFRDIGDLTREAERGVRSFKDGEKIRILNFSPPHKYEDGGEDDATGDVFTPVAPSRMRLK